MWIFVAKQLESWGYVGVFLIFLITIIIFAFKIGHFLGGWKDKEEKLNYLYKEFPSLIATVKVIQKTVDSIYGKIFPNAPIAASSPIKLTETGIGIAQSLKAHDFIIKNETKLKRLVEKENPKNAYDVQQACFSIISRDIEDLLSDEELSIAKKTSVDKGILLHHTLSIFAVILRDKILDDKGWMIGDVDKHTA